MADQDPLAEMFNLFAAPLAGAVRSIEQFRKGVDEFLRGVENFNRTMENLNETTERVNALVAEIEEPIRLAIPQVTRTVKAADDVMKVVGAPAMAAAPGLAMLAETLNTPAFTELPNQLAQFNELMTDLSTRLGPLAQFAESAGGLFGGLRMPNMGTQRSRSPTAAEDDAQDSAWESPSGKPSSRKPAAKKSSAKKAAAKKPAAKKSAAPKPKAKKPSKG